MYHPCWISELCSKIRTPHLGGVAQSHDGALTAAPRELTLCATLLFHRSGLPPRNGGEGERCLREPTRCLRR
jgi:hypothetical protein